MKDQELIYLSQRVAMKAAPVTTDTCVYVGTKSPEHRYELMKRLTDIADAALSLMAEVNKQEFSTQITEHVKAVEKGYRR
jgi:hypothetical protein